MNKLILLQFVIIFHYILVWLFKNVVLRSFFTYSKPELLTTNHLEGKHDYLEPIRSQEI